MYFTPNGRYAIVVQESYTSLAFYNPHTWTVRDTLKIPSCPGIDHMDFTADGTKLLASCEFADRMVVIDAAHPQTAPHRAAAPGAKRDAARREALHRTAPSSTSRT